MKERFLFAFAMVLVAASFAAAWTTELPSATTSTLGENQKREMLKLNLQEIRNTIDADRAVFSQYTAA